MSSASGLAVDLVLATPAASAHVSTATLAHLRELQRLRVAAGMPEESIAQLAALVLDKLRASPGRR